VYVRGDIIDVVRRLRHPLPKLFYLAGIEALPRVNGTAYLGDLVRALDEVAAPARDLMATVRDYARTGAAVDGPILSAGFQMMLDRDLLPPQQIEHHRVELTRLCARGAADQLRRGFPGDAAQWLIGYAMLHQGQVPPALQALAAETVRAARARRVDTEKPGWGWVHELVRRGVRPRR
jgi:hypothetical protein